MSTRSSDLSVLHRESPPAERLQAVAFQPLLKTGGPISTEDLAEVVESNAVEVSSIVGELRRAGHVCLDSNGFVIGAGDWVSRQRYTSFHSMAEHFGPGVHLTCLVFSGPCVPLGLFSHVSLAATRFYDWNLSIVFLKAGILWFSWLISHAMARCAMIGARNQFLYVEEFRGIICPDGGGEGCGNCNRQSCASRERSVA